MSRAQIRKSAASAAFSSNAPKYDPIAEGSGVAKTTSRPVIVVQGGGLSREASEGERALHSSGLPIYQRGSSLVRPVLEQVAAADGHRTAVAQLAPIELPYMRDLLCRSAGWRK